MNTTFRNVFAVLVHDNLECVFDLLRNLEHFDPSSLIVLYSGGENPALLGPVRLAHPNVIIHPSPNRQHWGCLHGFALDCMRLIAHLEFDALTIVDSDQLLLRHGYSGFIARSLAGKPRAGMLVNSGAWQAADTQNGPAQSAWAELERWRAFLNQFPNGEANFPRWAFWPSTVFTARGVRALLARFESDALLQEAIAASSICATEEVIFPSLVALLSLELLPHPCSFDFVQYRVAFSQVKLERALLRPDVFWVHPVPRHLDDRLRKLVRSRMPNAGVTRASVASRTSPSLPVWLYWEGECPDWIRACQDSVRAHAPDVRLIGPQDFQRLCQEHDDDLDLSGLQVAHRADVIRSVLLHRYGGLWVDSDCIVLRDLQPMLDMLEQVGFMAYRERQGNVANSFMGAKPGNRIAATYHWRVRERLQNPEPFGWLSLGSDLLTRTLEQSEEPWLELPTAWIQPVCWSNPGAFFAQREPQDHAAQFDATAWCYMLSNNMVRGFSKDHPGQDLLQKHTFFRYVLERARDAMPVMA
jgi:Capsular polysaccharide synthesis protein